MSFGEPWRVDGHYVFGDDDEQVYLYSNRARIADCVNACAGIENPDEAIREAREALHALINHSIDLEEEVVEKIYGAHYSGPSEAILRVKSALAKLKPKETV